VQNPCYYAGGYSDGAEEAGLAGLKDQLFFGEAMTEANNDRRLLRQVHRQPLEIGWSATSHFAGGA
jgi:hypothetical protein